MGVIRRKKEKEKKSGTDTQTQTHTDGHRDLKTESAQCSGPIRGKKKGKFLYCEK